jgi:molybdopterin-guanine dinucleotide biosynthesis protein MobB
MPPILTIMGRTNSGKTTLIERLIGHFNQKGCKISIIKHMKHQFNIDHEGKDSFRYREAGAFSALITNDEHFALISDNVNRLSPVELAESYLGDSDLVIIEGHKDVALPKIEVIGDSKEPPLVEVGMTGIIAIVSDTYIHPTLPCFKRDDIEGIADFIAKQFINR